MNGFSTTDFDFTFLDEGFCARDIVEHKINEVSLSDDKDAFYVADLGDVVKKHMRWTRALPRVAPYYAVKCNDSKAVVMTLASLGAGFDCASKNEIQLVQSIGVSPEKIIYANPCKQVSQIKYAAAHGVQMMTFDSEVELSKVSRSHSNAKLVLRIATDDSKAVCRLSVKFGATLKSCRSLLERAMELGVDIIGVSFHVGSGCTDPETYTQAISDARLVFDMGAEFGFNMHLLDIGGGFPGSEDVKLKFEEVTAVINTALDKYFPVESGVGVIAEPGRYYVASAYMLAVNVIAKKVVIKDQTGSDDEDDGANDRTLMYYVNDGVYGSFNCILYDHANVRPVLHKKPKPDERFYPCSIWGPTCDGLDRIVELCDMPDLQVGDWMLFENMGAYTVAASSTFNGFQKPDIHYVMSRTSWQLMQKIKEQGGIAKVEETASNPVPISCAWESGVELPSTCSSTHIVNL
ncbi:ornithine decarboxylase-like [Huso huso]|uniref:ornithine decarboxylase n=1 Tax=Huso huso TaxID=61971 RepID=A0ABR0ZUJ0_HUSHU